jgi:hypothetical protein
MVQDALLGVARDALSQVGEHGLRGNHHLYITFRTHFPGVDVPEHLRSKFAAEMTIVLQHQFFGLESHGDRFEVTLSFNKQLERLIVPWAAVTAFVDPSVNFGLQFQVEDVAMLPVARPAEGSLAEGSQEPAKQDGGEERPSAEIVPAPAPEGATVVSLDSFRKK